MIPLFHGFILAIILFVIGFTGVLCRRNFIFILFSLEIMINSVALIFVIVGNYLNQVDGQIIYIFIITLAAAEASIFLALLLRLYRRYHTLNIDVISEMRG